MDSNLFWCIVGLIGGGIISLIISAFFYVIGKKTKKLYFDINTNYIVSNKINTIKNLKLYYNDIKINNLYSTTITLKNKCKQTIEENDFSKYQPLSVYTGGEFIIYENSNELTPIYSDDNKKRCNKIIINFDFIPKNSSKVYTFIHTDSIDFIPSPKEIKVLDYIKIKRIKNIFSKIRVHLFYYIIIATIICSYIYNMDSIYSKYSQLAKLTEELNQQYKEGIQKNTEMVIDRVFEILQEDYTRLFQVLCKLKKPI